MKQIIFVLSLLLLFSPVVFAQQSMSPVQQPTVTNLFLQVRRISGNPGSQDIKTELVPYEHWRIVAKHITQQLGNSFFVNTDGNVKSCYRYENQPARCLNGKAVLGLDIRTTPDVQVATDLKIAKKNAKMGIFQTIAQIGGMILTNKLYTNGRYTEGQLAEYGAYQAFMLLEAQKAPDKYLVVTLHIDLDRFAGANNKPNEPGYIDRRISNFPIAKRFREYVIEVRADGSAIFKGQPEVVAGQDGKQKPGFVADEISNAYIGQNLGANWVTEVEGIALRQFAAEILK